MWRVNLFFKPYIEHGIDVKFSEQWRLAIQKFKNYLDYSIYTVFDPALVLIIHPTLLHNAQFCTYVQQSKGKGLARGARKLLARAPWAPVECYQDAHSQKLVD